MKDSTFAEVRRLAADILKQPLESIHADSTRDTLPAWDSMAHVNLVLALEQQFDIQFLPEEILEMLSIELVTLLVDEKIAAKGA